MLQYASGAVSVRVARPMDYAVASIVDATCPVRSGLCQRCVASALEPLVVLVTQTTTDNAILTAVDSAYGDWSLLATSKGIRDVKQALPVSLRSTSASCLRAWRLMRRCPLHLTGVALTETIPTVAIRASINAARPPLPAH